MQPTIHERTSVYIMHNCGGEPVHGTYSKDGHVHYSVSTPCSSTPPPHVSLPDTSPAVYCRVVHPVMQRTRPDDPEDKHTGWHIKPDPVRSALPASARGLTCPHALRSAITPYAPLCNGVIVMCPRMCLCHTQSNVTRLACTFLCIG